MDLPARAIANSYKVTGVPLGVYLHIPFCTVRCAYCDFNTYAGLEDLMPRYAAALARELELVGETAPQLTTDLDSVFFGGGTPSLMPAKLLEPVMAALRDLFNLGPYTEVTLEANPESVDLPSLQAWRGLGFNRLSFGVQSADPAELRLLDRSHDFETVRRAVACAREAGFDNLNLDLIYGLPGQVFDTWRASLQAVLDLTPEHLSLYALSLEMGTPMRARIERGELEVPDSDRAAEMYEWASEALLARGYCQYEISNWARAEPEAPDLIPTYACRHNLGTWRMHDYLGFGAGAHGYAAGWRYVVTRSPRAYIKRMEEAATGRVFPFSPAVAQRRRQDPVALREEYLFMGLRLVREGVNAQDYRSRLGRELIEDYGAVIEELQAARLVVWDGERLRLHERGRLLANQVFSRMLVDDGVIHPNNTH